MAPVLGTDVGTTEANPWGYSRKPQLCPGLVICEGSASSFRHPLGLHEKGDTLIPVHEARREDVTTHHGCLLCNPQATPVSQALPLQVIYKKLAEVGRLVPGRGVLYRLRIAGPGRGCLLVTSPGSSHQACTTLTLAALTHARTHTHTQNLTFDLQLSHVGHQA